MEPGSAERRIFLTKLMTEWALCTKVVFNGEYEKYNVLQIYKPGENDTDQSIFVRRGDTMLYILNEAKLPYQLTEKEAVKVIDGFSSWNAWHASMLDYLKETMGISRQVELSQAARDNQAILGKLQAKHKKSFSNINAEEDRVLAEIEAAKAKNKKREQEKKEFDKNLKDSERKFRSEIKNRLVDTKARPSLNSQIIEIKAKYNDQMIEELEKATKVHHDHLRGSLLSSTEKYNKTCTDARELYQTTMQAIQKKCEELGVKSAPMSIKAARQKLKEAETAAKTELRIFEKDKTMDFRLEIANTTLKIRSKYKYMAEKEIADLKEAIDKDIKKKLSDIKNEEFVPDVFILDEIEIPEYKKELYELRRKIVKEEHRIDKTNARLELKEQVADINRKYKERFKVSIRRIVSGLEYPEYI